MSKWAAKSLLILGLALCLLSSCSPPPPCEGDLSDMITINPDKLFCTRKCECNNHYHEGDCVNGVCISFFRETCHTQGQTRPCDPRLPRSSPCKDGHLQICHPPELSKPYWGNCIVRQPIAENSFTLCNDGKDNDCDGKIDSADPDCDKFCKPTSVEPCYSGPKGTADIGICKSGTRTCDQYGEWRICEGEILPQKETCSGKDENCNGYLDDGIAGCCTTGQQDTCYAGPPNTEGIGECRAGTRLCDNKQVWGSCIGEIRPSEEICDGKDNNCNGAIDEGCPCHYLDKPHGVCKGLKRDEKGICPKPPTYSEIEICDDGLDNNCNGIVDENCTCTPGESQVCGNDVGVCKKGIQMCDADGKWQALCEGAVFPTDEKCDGKDNNCNGVIDEGCPCNYLDKPYGVCKNLKRDDEGKCPKHPDYNTTEICDGLDNDCDGVIDNKPDTSKPLEKPCYNGQPETRERGECKDGKQLCILGNWSACTNEMHPSAEICDGKDNNCNGIIDEGCPCNYIDKTYGVCANGKIDDSGKCSSPQNYSTTEICDGLDNDCDGVIDNKPGTSEPLEKPCYNGQPETRERGECKDGKQLCILGNWSACFGEMRPSAEICDGKDNNCDGSIDQGVVCPQGKQCRNGACVCANDTTECSGVCVNTNTDNNHCGGCGTKCASGQLCFNSKCVFNCPTGQTACSGSCVDTNSDHNNCGTCGNKCTGGMVCTNSKCACPSGLTNCSGICQDLTNDLNNCGTCGTKCTSGQLCSNGKCVFNCPTGQTACSGSCVDTTSDQNNCGGCNKKCAVGEKCVNGVCCNLTPGYGWQQVIGFGGQYEDEGTSIVVDNANNIYITGSFKDTATFGNTILTSEGDSDIFVAKIEPSGNWSWVHRVGGIQKDSSHSIALDKSGNTYITGSFSGRVVFNATTLTATAGSDIFVAKLNPSGYLVWATSAGGIGNSVAYGIAADSNNNAYITGSFRGSVQFTTTILSSSIDKSDMFVAKINTSGQWVWAKSSGSDQFATGRSVAVDSSNNIYVTGSFYSNSSAFGPTPITSLGLHDMFVTKLDSSGNWLWARRAGGGTQAGGTGVATDTFGNIYVTGNFSDSATFGTTTLTTASPSSGVFVSKLDSAGAWLWSKGSGEIGAHYSRNIAIDGAGNAYITGAFIYTMELDSYKLYSNGINNDVFVAKISDHGQWLWAIQAGGTSADEGNSIALGTAGNPYIIGFFQNAASFGTMTLTSRGNKDIFVAKIDYGAGVCGSP